MINVTTIYYDSRMHDVSVSAMREHLTKSYTIIKEEELPQDENCQDFHIRIIFSVIPTFQQRPFLKLFG